MFTTKTSAVFTKYLRNTNLSIRTATLPTRNYNAERRSIHSGLSSDASMMEYEANAPTSNKPYHSMLLRVVISNVSGMFVLFWCEFHPTLECSVSPHFFCLPTLRLAGQHAGHLPEAPCAPDPHRLQPVAGLQLPEEVCLRGTARGSCVCSFG
jgi:hypothetical protein